MKRILAVAILSLLAAAAADADDAVRLTIVHTNDIQSRLLPFAPNADYTPGVLGDDATIGGVARLATIVRRVRARGPERTLVVDGGDVMMGTLFQTMAQATGLELRLLGRIGYDAVTLGNHEFDFHTDGLARIVTAARDGAAARGDTLPALLLANGRFDPADPADDALAALFDDGTLRPSVLVERAGLKIGLFGVMGRHAASVSAYARPMRFVDLVESARETTAALREAGADVVIALSHGGARKIGGIWMGDDIDLAKEVDGLDVVVGGHTHEPIFEPVVRSGTVVVQAGSETRWVGVLELLVETSGVRVESYELLPVDDTTAAAEDVAAMIAEVRDRLDAEVLAPYGLRFADVQVETAFDLFEDVKHPTGGNLGPLVADAIRWRSSDLGEPLDVAITTAGMIRDNVVRGRTGLQQTSDLFRVMPLGVGTVEDTPGYPLARAYLTAPELKNVLEVLLVGYRFRGRSYYPYYSGLRFRYNPYRVFLDRVFEVEIGDAEQGFRKIDLKDEETLYSVGMNAYFLHYVHMVGELSLGLFSMTPRLASGEPLTDVQQALIDADPARPGVQEGKEWRALIEYVRRFPDTDGDGVADVPERYREVEPRAVAAPSLDPRLLYRNAGPVMWGATVGLALFVLGLAAVLRRWRRRRRRLLRP